MKKSLLAVSLLMAAGSVSAEDFYLDLGVNYDGLTAPAGNKECDTCTSMKDLMLFEYESRTTILDLNTDGVISAGDAVSTDGGLSLGGKGVGALVDNQITGFVPNETLGAESNNGLNSDYALSFQIDDLTGVVTGVSPLGVPELAYGPGSMLELFITFDGTTFNNFMDILIDGAVATGVSTAMTGRIDFTTVDAGYNDLFHSGDHTCAGSDSFFDIWTNCGEGGGEALSIDFMASFDTNVFVSDFTSLGGVPEVFQVETSHTGSALVAIPEPNTLALMGGSLLMLAGIARRRRKQ